MVTLALRSGTTDIVATPHADLKYHFDPEIIGEKLTELRRFAPAGIRIHRGCDFHLFYDNIEGALANPARFTINGGCYLLVEFSDLLIFNSTTEIFRRLMGAGMVPVITHPERNWLLQQRMEQLREWAALGCLLQVTGQSFLGRFGRDARKFAEELMKQSLVHVVASDAHDCEDRTPRLDEAFAYVSKHYGEARARHLFLTNPGRILAGEPVGEEAPVPSDAPRKWYQFWAG